MAVSKRLRYEILRRDSNTCRLCGRSAPEVKLTVDHVVPKALGGSDDPSNLQAACVDCNAGKSASSPDSSLVADVDERAARYARAYATVVQQRTEELANEAQHLEWFKGVWGAWEDGTGELISLDGNWESTILRFLGAGLSRDFLKRAVSNSMGIRRIKTRDKWRYFCGIGWRELDKIRDQAIQLAEGVIQETAQESDEELADGFPYMEVIGQFIDDLMSVAKLDERAQKIAHRSFWDAIHHADTVWRNRSFGDADLDEMHEACWRDSFEQEGIPLDEDEKPSRHDLALEAVSSYAARDMYEISIVLAEGRSPDGS